jgi:hypothetical protein
MSNRLADKPLAPAWAFKSSKKLFQSFRQEALRLLRQDDIRALIRTDVRGYYASLGPEQLKGVLAEFGCDPEAASLLLSAVRHWQLWQNVRGLPVGPEACAVLGVAYLHPLDQVLERGRGLHLRWMDDLLIFGGNLVSCERLLAKGRAQVHALGLRLSEEKTERFDDVGAAELAIHTPAFDSLRVILNANPAAGEEEVRKLFKEMVQEGDEPSPTSFRWLIRAMANRRDPYAAKWVVENLEHFNIDPRESASYIGRAAIDDASVTDELFHHLEQVPDDRTEGAALHICRTLRSERWGEPEGKAFSAIARDARRAPPVRCWAWEASAASPAWRADETMELALYEADPMVKRAAVLTLRGSESRLRASFLREVAAPSSPLRYAARWVGAV